MKNITKWFKGLDSNKQVGLLLVPLLAIAVTASASSSPDETNISTQNTAKTRPVVTTKSVDQVQAIPFASTTIESVALPKGTTKITTAGVNGSQTLTFKVTITDGKETGKVQEGATRITLNPVTQVTTIGTYVAPTPPPKQASNCDPNYTPCVPNVSYDLNCADIGFRVRVIGTDVHGFDGNDNDGLGCESY